MLWLYTKFVLHSKSKLHKERRRYAPVPMSSSSNARWASTILCPPSRKDLIICLRYVQFPLCNQMNAVLTKQSPNSIDSSFDSMVIFLSLMEISAPSTNFHQEPESSMFWSVLVSSTKEGDSPHPIQPLTIWAYSSCMIRDLKMSKKSSTMHRLHPKTHKTTYPETQFRFSAFRNHSYSSTFRRPTFNKTVSSNMFYCNSRTPAQMRKVWSHFAPAL